MTNSLSPEGCNTLDLTLTGDNEVPEGIDSDGYMASYTYTLAAGLLAGDVQMTCLGAEEDGMGYHCIGAMGGEEDGMYSVHGAGYWNLTEEELAEIEAAKAAAEEAGEDDGEDEEAEGEADEYAEEDYYAEDYGTDDYGYDEEVEETLEEWAARGNPMDDAEGAWYEPASVCAGVYDEYYGEEDFSSCVVENFGGAFAGGWFQPADADEYEGNFRMGAGMTTWVTCVGGGEVQEMVASAELTGATALTAGATLIALSALY